MWWHDGWGWGFGFLHMVLYWGVLILVIALVVKWIFGGPSGPGWLRGDFFNEREARGNRALDILKERYARGEIDKEEFEQKKRDLQA